MLFIYCTSYNFKHNNIIRLRLKYIQYKNKNNTILFISSDKNIN